jgi:hypothetical protein
MVLRTLAKHFALISMADVNDIDTLSEKPRGALTYAVQAVSLLRWIHVGQLGTHVLLVGTSCTLVFHHSGQVQEAGWEGTSLVFCELR